MITLPTIDPVLFSVDIAGLNLAIRWYALAYIAAFLLGWRWIAAMCRNTGLRAGAGSPISRQQLEHLVTWSILGVIVGGRLGYVVIYDFRHFVTNPADIARVWQGGMSFHGGALGMFIVIWAFSRANSIRLAALTDMIAVAACPGLLLGRLANFVNGELWGHPSHLPWAVTVSDGPGAVCPPDWVGLCARHPSQLYEAALEGLVLGLVLAVLIYRSGWLRHPGRITGMFIAGYGVARMIGEFFRTPDAQFITLENPIGYALPLSAEFGLTMGQLLSAPMIIVGLIIIARCWKSHCAV